MNINEIDDDTGGENGPKITARLDGELTKLHPDHVKVTRIIAVIWTATLAIPLLLVEAAHYFQDGFGFLPRGLMITVVIFAIIFFVVILPKRRYNHRGFHMSSDRIRIVRGYLFRIDTVVPFGRIQHIDVDQGPIQRRFDLATLTVHTAGNHNSSVMLPGLLHRDATAMREEIRAHIRQETL